MYCYKLTIAYEGEAYCGYQIQPNGNTVQGELMRAVVDLCGPDATITAASRTDSGVHARGQVVLLKTVKQISVYKIPMALNVRLPRDIVVVDAQLVDASFHPRYTPHVKTYEYLIYNGSYQYPQDRHTCYHYKKQLDLSKMIEGAQLLIGTHDFESYSSSGKSVENTIRTITDIDLVRKEDMIHIRVSGTGFLYNMVRIIVGTLMELGTGKRNLDTIQQSLNQRDRHLTGKTAPAEGLTLLKIDYHKENTHE